jgi:hypothetical protein
LASADATRQLAEFNRQDITAVSQIITNYTNDGILRSGEDVTASSTQHFVKNAKTIRVVSRNLPDASYRFFVLKAVVPEGMEF